MGWGSKPVAARMPVEVRSAARAVKHAEVVKKRHRRTKAEMQAARAIEASAPPGMKHCAKCGVIFSQRHRCRPQEQPRFPIPQREEDDTRHALRQRLLAPEPEGPREKILPERQAELDWHALKAKKGWNESTVIMLLEEFLAKNTLFPQLMKGRGR